MTIPFFLMRVTTKAKKAPKTKIMQTIIQAEMEESPSTFGELLVMVLKMLIRTRKRVTRIVIRPVTISTGMMKLA